MVAEWYYSKDGEEYGPATIHDLKRLVESHWLQPHDLVRKHDATKWAPASSIEALFPTSRSPTYGKPRLPLPKAISLAEEFSTEQESGQPASSQAVESEPAIVVDESSQATGFPAVAELDTSRHAKSSPNKRYSRPGKSRWARLTKQQKVIVLATLGGIVGIALLSMVIGSAGGIGGGGGSGGGSGGSSGGGSGSSFSSRSPAYQDGYEYGVNTAENRLGLAPASMREKYAEALHSQLWKWESQRKERQGHVPTDRLDGMIDGCRSVLRKYGVD
jgi:hypothetical protein